MIKILTIIGAHAYFITVSANELVDGEINKVIDSVKRHIGRKV